MNYSKLKFLLTQRNLSIRKLAEMIGYSEAGFHTMMKHDKMQVNTLEKIAEILEINPCDLIVQPKQQTAYSQASEPAPSYGQNAHLHEKIIDTQNKVIDLLTSELKRAREELQKNGASE